MSEVFEGKTDKQDVFKLIAMPTRIIVKEDPFEYKGRIIIPDKAKGRPTTAIVIAVGRLIQDVSVGEHILYAQYSGTGVNLRNQPALRIIVEDEILCKIEGDIALEDTVA